MTEAEIWETINGFVQAARRCREASFDGVEVWAAYLGTRKIGDCAAPRQAPYALYEGRKTGLEI